MKTKKNWTDPKITEVNIDNEISALMVSPPGDPFASNSINIENNNCNEDPYA